MISFLTMTIIGSFLVAAVLALFLTPFVIRWACNHDVCDYPSPRRIHGSCIPRAGGIVIFISFMIACSAALLTLDGGSGVLIFRREQIFLFLGAFFIFLIGFGDDMHGLAPWQKFMGQVGVGILVWFGGIDIEMFSITLHSGAVLPQWLSLLATVFWVVFLVNAMNLIDGLDGLAAGICLFVSIILLTLCAGTATPMVIIGFSALAGTCFGFLRYNFNPATIFMGDGGSYLLGYLLAVLTIEGAMKSHAALAMLIPVIALGVPLFDTLLAPVRRFILGKKMFQADKGHIHHLLLKNGHSQRQVVVIIYGITIILGGVALSFVYVKDQFAAFLLVIPGIILFFMVRKMGYLEYIASDKLLGWLRDLTDEAGFSNDRRSFLNLQMMILKADTVNELWSVVTVALEKLDFDYGELHIQSGDKNQGDMILYWFLMPGKENFDFHGDYQFKLELPLINENGVSYGVLWMVKDLKRANMNHYTLRRVEQLRRTVVGVLERLSAPPQTIGDTACTTTIDTAPL